MLKAFTKILLSLIVVFLSITAFAYDSKMIEERDTNMVDLLVVDSVIINDIQNDPNYVFDRVENYGFWDMVSSRVEGIVDKIIDWIERMTKDMDVKTPKFPKKFVTIMLVGLFILVILVIIILIVNHNRKNRKQGVKAISKFEAKEEKENIIENDYNKLLLDAELKQQYRLCVRYLFNNLLKKLNEEEYIDWAYKKTNYDYFTELRKTDFADDYKELSWIYDNIWYGEKVVDFESYNKIKNIFTNLNSKIDES